MPEFVRWFDRAFAFDLEPWMFPNVVERLRGTPARLEEAVRGVTATRLVHRVDDAWSIQEHAGHLLDLEPLWSGRLDDFDAGADRLRPADLENRKTHEAAHNDASLDALLADFRAARASMVARLDAMGDEAIVRAALHPRLDQPMRVLDSAFFVAEHDDHHLAWIARLKR